MRVSRKQIELPVGYLLSIGGTLLEDDRILFDVPMKCKIINLSYSFDSHGKPTRGKQGSIFISEAALNITLEELKAELWYDPEQKEIVALEMYCDYWNKICDGLVAIAAFEKSNSEKKERVQ
ncbi:hypothetical protein EHQ12_04055 [Leptospira gomenensis]|uniref:Uncharacterized protein n=1 Tax=Leptospira gomenensis TaxID=2484974 RepID=A0A5F1YDI7_9LEPT|nr:hypothetical protein [Leptospira gomenensis]TGK36210.1 hypothetical protein EHQ17_04665 [Leptospira gomenensis]TGK42752.1 hypothetical protein EHQ07_13835 [Leptospira gomenensis]TGK42939.1 hypothetical protein EHQ12_04055 [Leptospira gomenensis]TGK54951.1 hypothetical protein EHQ13_18310 [Leptospira gomenensis]